jgi:hypothetical protein
VRLHPHSTLANLNSEFHCGRTRLVERGALRNRQSAATELPEAFLIARHGDQIDRCHCSVASYPKGIT